ncbi:MAG: PilZ domain-containing protein [Elusimicrobia bacterium]|jgi:hypothetical protein|nr:PilZ domain-containing protein [Elusimicrobiota bacterium]
MSSSSNPPSSDGSASRADRALFRVEFPFRGRPLCEWSGVRFEVLDISERGMRLSVEGHTPFVRGTWVRAVVYFEDSPETVEGTVLRGNEREAVFQLREGFSLERIRREERRLIRATRPPSPLD